MAFPSVQAIPGFSAITQLHLDTPVEQEWNLAIQRSLGGNSSFEIAYVGKELTHLQNNGVTNVPTPGPGSVQARRPFVTLGQGSYITNDGTSNYNGLQLKAEKRFSQGLSFLATYTWSKTLGNFSGDAGGSGYQDPLNRRANYGPLTWDFRHVAVFQHSL